jgi:anti-sigma factor RsiW
VALLRRHQDAVVRSFDPGCILEAVRREADRRRLVRAGWRRSVAAAGVVVAFGAGLVAYQAGLLRPSAASTDPFSQALFREHQRYESALAADRDLNVQVAALEQ